MTNHSEMGLRCGFEEDPNIINMVDPSGGPYISLGNNLKEFWPKGKYQDLIVESIKFVPQSDEDKDDYKSTVIFKVK